MQSPVAALALAWVTFLTWSSFNQRIERSAKLPPPCCAFISLMARWTNFDCLRSRRHGTDDGQGEARTVFIPQAFRPTPHAHQASKWPTTALRRAPSVSSGKISDFKQLDLQLPSRVSSRIVTKETPSQPLLRWLHPASKPKHRRPTVRSYVAESS